MTKTKKEKCSYANRYKAKRKPTCGCKSCEDKWEKVQLERRVKELEEKVGQLERAFEWHNDQTYGDWY